MSVTRRLLAAALLATLLVPAAQALEVATKSVRARPSSEYSPNTAWDLGYYGCGVTIAVFDEGIDDSHPYLKGKVVAGYDTTVTATMWTLANGGNPQPLSGTHGTPVAGIAASHAGQMFTRTEDAPQWADGDLVGAAPCAWLVDVMFYDLEGASDADMVAAFDWAIQHKDDTWGDSDPSNDGIEVITMSWSPYDATKGDDPVSQAANRAVAAGIVVLGSAGNSGGEKVPDIGAPAGSDGAIAVANIVNRGTASRADDVIEPSSTWGPRTNDGDADPYEELKPDIAAPGTGVSSTGPALADGTEYQVACLGVSVLGYGCETPFGGTSAATPLVAGIVALMLEANPDLEPRDVKEILRRTGENIGFAPSAPALNAKWNHQHGFGLVDAYAAVVMARDWPGYEAGRDRDGDGVPDVDDVGPTDPAEARRKTPPKTSATSTSQPPAASSRPARTPAASTTTTEAPLPAEEPTVAEPDEQPLAPRSDAKGREAPAPWLALVALVALGLAWRRRS